MSPRLLDTRTISDSPHSLLRYTASRQTSVYIQNTLCSCWFIPDPPFKTRSLTHAACLGWRPSVAAIGHAAPHPCWTPPVSLDGYENIRARRFCCKYPDTIRCLYTSCAGRPLWTGLVSVGLSVLLLLRACSLSTHVCSLAILTSRLPGHISPPCAASLSDAHSRLVVGDA